VAASTQEIPESVAEFVELENRDRIAMGFGDRLADRVTALCGDIRFFAANFVWFAVWIVLNEIPATRFDPYPYGMLTTAVSLEAIFLAIFVLISQNRQALQSDKRAKVDLQVNLIAEQEVTKAISLLVDIQKRLGAHLADEETREMQKPTRVSELADVIDEAERVLDPEGAKGPSSAVDTEA
jgi:uncharacterized membrane protein